MTLDWYVTGFLCWFPFLPCWALQCSQNNFTNSRIFYFQTICLQFWLTTFLDYILITGFSIKMNRSNKENHKELIPIHLFETKADTLYVGYHKMRCICFNETDVTFEYKVFLLLKVQKLMALSEKTCKECKFAMHKTCRAFRPNY